MCWESDMENLSEEERKRDSARKQKLNEALKEIIIEGFKREEIFASKN